MKHWPIDVCGPPDGDLEAALLTIQAEFLLRHGSRWVEARELAGPAYARALRLGRELFSSGELARLGKENASVGTVLDGLIRELCERM